MADDVVPRKVVIVGAGFCGLTAAFELAQRGHSVTVLEADDAIGGLAGSFPVGGQRLEKFYHHWFTNDVHVNELVADLGVTGNVVHRETRTGSYYANSLFRLSRPFDVLKYRPLSLFGRVRLGLLVLQARAIKDWRKLEDMTAHEWLRRTCGKEVTETVWKPLLEGKFGKFADKVSAVWMWNKLILRGGSRGKGGAEVLAYYKGGFAALADALAERVRALGADLELGNPATGLEVSDGRVRAVLTRAGRRPADVVLHTPSLPIFSELVRGHVSDCYLKQLAGIEYLGNTCLTLELDRSLSDTYWINVIDPGFPFVGVIEHTNFEPASAYAGRHIVYLSKYLPTTDALYRMDEREFLDFALPYLKRMFTKFERDWIVDAHLHKAQYSQPIITKRYSEKIPAAETPIAGVYLSTMAQIYPEDRGTNYAIREGRKVAGLIHEREAAPLHRPAAAALIS